MPSSLLKINQRFGGSFSSLSGSNSKPLQITICFKLVSCLDHEDGSGMFFRTVS
jgi:hypothetical protein